MSDDEDGLTDEELETIAQGIKDLHLIDALMTALKQTLCKYPEQDRVATGIFGEILDDAANLVLAWQEFAASPFGMQFDPRIDPPDEEDV